MAKKSTKSVGGFTLTLSLDQVSLRKRMPRPGVAMASRREKTPRHRQDHLEEARRWG
jgi:hypothetical protein